MCTAISEKGKHPLFGRTLDFEMSYGESVVITPRNFVLKFIHEGENKSHSAIMGIAHVSQETPLYYDAINEDGLAVAGLNFPGNAVYNDKKEGFFNVASFEFIPFVLSRCKNVSEARELLERTNITNDSFEKELPTSPLHFIVSDQNESITVEPLSGGLCIYENPFSVLTNNPTFDFHTTHVANFMSLSSAPATNTLCPKTNIKSYSRGMGALWLPGDYSSTSRFVRALFMKNHSTHENDETGEINRFFHIMDTVSLPRGCVKTDEGRDVLTIYTSCASLNGGKYYYTTYENRGIRSISFSDSDLLSSKLFTKPI